MSSIDKLYNSYAKNILKEIADGTITTHKQLEERSFYHSKTLKLKEMPSHPFILSCIKKPSKKMTELLLIKPTRSLSGVQVIAVMLPPFPCPGECTYCPSAFEGKIAPKSYTGFEPSTLRAQRLGYDSFKIVQNRILQLDATGHHADKIELIFQGSTFTSMPKPAQTGIVKKSFDAVLGKVTPNFDTSRKLAEKSKRRIVGVTYEIRPDYCKESDIEHLLYLGGTRVELGVQTPDDRVYDLVKRGHTVKDVTDATARLKDSAVKVLYHLMPGLPGTTPKQDIKNFKKIFSDPNFRPDMVKFYPCLVIQNSELYNQWKKGEFTPISEKDSVRVLSEIKSIVPPWVRIMRVNRDIPSTVISGGIKKTNLRQMVETYMKEHDLTCNCIRCREAGLQSRNREIDFSKAKLQTRFYEASGGEEAFISMESKDSLFGFVRLRNPNKPFIKTIAKDTALIRELHVYGKALSMGEKDIESTQHRGFGKELMEEAERVAKEKYDAKKLAVISGIGVREYYKKNFNYKIDEPFVSKKL